MNNMNSFCYSFIDVLIEFINSVIPLHFFYKQLHFLLQHQFNYGSMNFQSESFPRSSRPEAFLSKVFWKYAANLQQNTHAEVWFQIALQRYWNHTSAWVFSCKFAAYFQNTFSLEHVCVAASVFQQLLTKFNSTSGCWMISVTWSINFQMIFLFYMSLSLPCLFSICQLRKLLAEPWVLASVA